MKKLLILFLLLTTGLAFAQTITIGSGTLTQRYPLGNWYGYERSAALYTAAEVTTGGNITKLAWYATIARSTTIPMKIYLKETSSSTLSSVTWASMITGATLVYDDNNTSITANAWNEFSITSFSYSGSDNLLVLVEANYGGSGTGTSSGTGVRYSTATSRHEYWQADGAPPAGSGIVTSNRPNIQITFAPAAALDMGAIALAAPGTTGCYSSSETVTIKIKNFGSALIDFSADPCTVSASVTGPNPTTFPDVVLNSGTLASGATQDVVVSSSYDMSAAGTYTFDAFTTVSGDGNAGNDAMPSTNRTVVAPVSLPQSVDFTGFNGTNLNTVFPNWYEAAGTSPSGSTSLWTSQTGLGGPGNITARINLYTTSRNEWIVGPKFTASSATQLKFKAAVTDWNSIVNPDAMGSDDKVRVMISTDCGVSWSSIYQLDATSGLTTTLTEFTVPLSAYSGSDIIIAFYATDGPVDDPEDYDFHLDDINIENVVPMTYSSSAVTQNNTSFTVISATNQEVIGIEVVTTGSLSPIDITKFTINANGTTDVSDIENAKIYYTGTSPVFATINQFGSTYASPTVADFDITGTQTLATGTNYFWLTFDVKPSATIGNVIDGECTMITVDGTDYVPSPTSVSGSRLIRGPLSGNYTVGSVLFNSITGKDLYFEKSVNKVMREIEVEVPQVETKGNNTSVNQNNKLEESILKTTTKQLVEVEEVNWIPMVNGKVYTGPLAVYKSDHPELNFPEGVEAVYATITAAVADLNALGVSGWVNFLLTDASYSSGETFPITIDIASPFQPTSSNTVTIKPDAGVATLISGSSAVAIFKLNGADYIIIDGVNAGGSSMTIENTNSSTSSSVIWLATKLPSNGATNNTVKNCTIRGNSPTTTLSCIISSGSSIGGVAEAQNNNNVFSNNTILKAQYGIAAVGPTGNEVGLTIEENVIGSSTPADQISFNGVAVFQQSNALISKNNISGVVSATSATASGIRVAGTADGILIQKNNINNIKNTNTGGWGSNGIQLNSSSNPANVNVENNFISDVASYGYSSAGVADNGYGIVLVSGGGYKIYHNSVNLTTNQSVLTGLPSAINITSGITTAGSVDIRNNLFINSQTFGTQRYAFYSGAANTVYSLINYNNYLTTGPNLGYLGGNLLDLAALQAATGQDLNSKSVAVTFVGAPDLHLAGSSVGDINLLGDNLTSVVTNDIDGDSRLAPPAGPYMGADEGSIPLPVELSAFDVKVKMNVVQLHWITKTEINSAAFEVQRSRDNNEWIKVGLVTAAGNSNSPKEYNFIDNKLQSGKYSYRLKMIDADGKFAYSNVVEVDVSLPKEYAISQNYPNPFNPTTRIDYQLPFDSKVTIELYGITGEKVATLVNSNLSAGYYTAEVNAGQLNLASGIYIYRMVATGVNNQNFTQVKKLMLTK